MLSSLKPSPSDLRIVSRLGLSENATHVPLVSRRTPRPSPSLPLPLSVLSSLGVLGDKIKVAKEKSKIIVTVTEIPFSKRYLKVRDDVLYSFFRFLSI